MIEIKKLYKRFEDKVVYKDFNLKIEDGEFVVLTGESGCGKSTLLNMIGGIEAADGGEILVDGMDILKNKNKRKYYHDIVGFLFQNFALLENKTVLNNLSIIQKDGRSEISIDDALKRVGLSKMIYQKVYKLSGGEQQRLALARLMVKRCSLVLADEPTGSLDEKNAEIVMKILHELNKMGKTVLVVTHSQKIVEAASRVVHLPHS